MNHPMPNTLPDPGFRAMVADAVHHAISKLFEPSVHHVAPINTIGSFLLQHLMRREYRPVAGSVRIRAGGTPFGLEADLAQIDAHEYYVWCACRHGDGRVEIVDFCARYWRDWARGLGQLWIGAAPPEVVWAWDDELPHDFAEYEVHTDITRRVQYTVARAIAERDPGGPVGTWENAINDAIHFIASSEEGLAFLADAGLAEPIDEDKG